MKLVGFGLVVLAILTVLIAISGFIVMLLSNVLLEHYGVKTLGFTEGIALALLLSMVGTASRASSTKKA